MKKMNLEIDGEMKDCLVFDSMWEYLEFYGTDITHYALDPAPYTGEMIIGKFKPIEDVDFGTPSSERVEIDEKFYQHVNWGEEEYTMIPESGLEAEFWTVYEWDGESGYICTGQIFQTREEAETEIEEVA